MSLPDHYLLTVALHAVVLSAAVFLAIHFLRKPQQLALTALCGALAIATLPWISALRPREPEVAEIAAEPLVSPVASLPQWTVLRIPNAEAAEIATPPSPSSFSMPAVSPVVAIWTMGSLIALGVLLTAALRILRWQGALAKPDDAAWQAIFDAAPDAPGRRHFRISPAEGSPHVAGFFNPLVVIPSFLLDPAKRRELRWALRHELRHWQGSDSRWTMVLEWIRVTQWWNPFVHPLIARWKLAREIICDLAASKEERSDYGEFLIEMAAKPASRNPLAVTMVRRQRLKSLRSRIVAVLKAAPGSAKPLGKGVFFSTCGAILAASLMISCVGIGNREAAKSAAGSTGDETPTLVATAKSGLKSRSNKLPTGMTAQVKISTTILFPFDAPAAADGSILSEEEMRHLKIKYARIKGTWLMSMPSVTTRLNEAAMIEMIREHPDDPPWKVDLKAPTPRKNRFTGWSLVIAPSYEGKEIRLGADIGYGFIAGPHDSHHAETQPRFDEREPIAWKKLVRKNASGAAELAPRETLAINLGEVERGVFATVFMTVTPIDATGREVASFEEAIHKPEPPKEVVSGKVKLEGIHLDDAGDSPILDDHGANMGMSAIFTADQWKVAKDGIEGKPLGGITLDYGHESEPWEELFPGVKLAVWRYKDESHLNIRFTIPRHSPWDPRFPPDFTLTCAPGSAVIVDLAGSNRGQRHCLVVVLEESK